MNFNLPLKKELKNIRSKNHPVKRVSVDPATLQAAIKKAKENEKNWYRKSDDEDEIMLDYLS